MKYLLPLCLLLSACPSPEEEYNAGYEDGCEFGTEFSEVAGYNDGLVCLSVGPSMQCHTRNDGDYNEGLKDGCFECGYEVYNKSLLLGREDGGCDDE